MCMGVTRNRELIAVVAYHDYDPHARVMQMSAAASNKRWLCRNVLYQMYAYPFVTVDCQMVVKRVAPDNKDLLSQLDRLGFEFIRVPRLRGENEDEILCTLTREKWEAGKYSKGKDNG